MKTTRKEIAADIEVWLKDPSNAVTTATVADNARARTKRRRARAQALKREKSLVIARRAVAQVRRGVPNER